MYKKLLVTGIIAAVAFSCGQGGDAPKEASDEKPDEELLQRAQSFFDRLPEPKSFDRPVAKLGKRLYYETALSVSNEISCNSCHLLDNFGVDNEKTSPGHDGTRGDRNSPTVYNAWFHIAQFWDGRAEDLTEQAKGPILNPVEMGMPEEKVAIGNIRGNPEYEELFREVFPDEEEPITFHNIALAIAEFEHTLATPSPFDEYIQGDTEALSEDQKEGLQTFIDAGCITCHTGPGLGGNMYQKFGLRNGPYWEYTGSEHEDEGRYEVTEKESDKYMFKVPSLRNVTQTRPYFHDGSVDDLEEAIRIMGITQLDEELSEEEVRNITTFLESLTGEIPGHALVSEDKPEA